MLFEGPKVNIAPLLCDAAVADTLTVDLHLEPTLVAHDVSLHVLLPDGLVEVLDELPVILVSRQAAEARPGRLGHAPGDLGT